jgi:hypothetical protein
MSQADSPNTTSPSRRARPAATFSTVERLNFQSAGAVRKNPRFDKTYCSQCGGEFGPGNSGYSHCQDHRKPVLHDSVLARHDELVAAIIAAKPHVIRYGDADAHDLKDRSDHVDAIGKAMVAYLSEIVDDTAYNANGVDRDCGALSDALSDIVGNIMNAADERLKDEGRVGGFW